MKAAPTSVRERVERLHCCLCLRQAPCSPLCKSMERLSCNRCQVWPGGRCSRVSTTLARDWRRVAVSPQNPPVLSRTSGSNPKFCRAQRCCMSVCCRFRSVYLSAAARGVVAEGRNTELWNGDVIAQSKANLGNRLQEDWWTSGKVTINTSAGRARGWSGRRCGVSSAGRAPARAARR